MVTLNPDQLMRSVDETEDLPSEYVYECVIHPLPQAYDKSVFDEMQWGSDDFDHSEHSLPTITLYDPMHRNIPAVSG